MPQRVLVTAGGAGIGREIARAFAGTGARVLLLERTINQGAPLIVFTNWINADK